MLLLSTSNFNWYWLHKIFDFAKKSNYDWIELVLNKNQYDYWDADYILWLIKEFWVKVLSLKAPKRWLNEKLVWKIYDLAIKIWAKNITFTPPYFKDKNISWYLDLLPSLKEKNKIFISIENVEPKFILFIIPEYRDANLKQIQKVTWDTALNLGYIDTNSWIDIMKALQILWSSIKNIYLSDNSWEKKWLLPGKAKWGTSFLAIESFLMKLKAISYKWFVTLEVNPKELWVWDEQKILKNLEDLKKYYEKYIK